MKKIFALLIVSFLHQIVIAQTQQNFSIKQGLRLFGYSKTQFIGYMQKQGYSYKEQYSNFLTYNKSSRISSYDFTSALTNGKVTTVSWDEFVGNYRYITSELDDMGFDYNGVVNNLYNKRSLLSYENLERNLLVTLITKGNYFTVTIGVKNPGKPFVSQSVYDAKELRLQKEEEALEKAEAKKQEEQEKLALKLKKEKESKFSKVVFDIEKENPDSYYKFKIDLTERLRNAINEHVSSFDYLVKKIEAPNQTGVSTTSNIYGLFWETELDEKQEDGITLSKDYFFKGGGINAQDAFKYCETLKMPEIIKDGVSVPKKTLRIRDIEATLTRGIAIVKLKKDIQYLKFKPTEDIQAKIASKLSGQQKGTYLVKYQHGKILMDNIDEVSIELLKKNEGLGGTLLKLGFLLL